MEAEPKHTTLDDLPKVSINYTPLLEHRLIDDYQSPGRKRKGSPDVDDNGRFAAGHRGHNKRARGGGKGGRGGRGRGRKKGSLGAEHDDLKNDVEEDHTPPTFHGAGVAEKPNASPPSPRVTRQQKRLSGGSDTLITLSDNSRANSQKLDTRKARADSDDTAIGEQTVSKPLQFLWQVFGDKARLLFVLGGAFKNCRMFPNHPNCPT